MDSFAIQEQHVKDCLVGLPYLGAVHVGKRLLSSTANLPESCAKAPFICSKAYILGVHNTFRSNPWDSLQ